MINKQQQQLNNKKKQQSNITNNIINNDNDDKDDDNNKSMHVISRLLEREVKRLWNGIEVVLIPIVIGALGTVSKRFHLF